MNAQLNNPQGRTDKLTGEYYLQGVMETASGFKFNADHSFQFFFSYGALDRSGEGRWEEKDNKVILNSRKYPGSDFALITSNKNNSDLITIKIIDSNSFFNSHVYCLLKSGGIQTEQFSNNLGLISFPKQLIDSISLAFEFCGERRSVFLPLDPSHNYFEFKFEPWIMEVFFSGFTLEIEKNGLIGPHPLLKPATYHFRKN